MKKPSKFSKLAVPFVVLFHAAILIDVGYSVFDKRSWDAPFSHNINEQISSTETKIHFVEKRNLTDKEFQAELLSRALSDCRGCNLDFEKGTTYARRQLDALKRPEVRSRYAFWHSLTMISWGLFWSLNFLLMLVCLKAQHKGIGYYLVALAYCLPFLTLFYAFTYPAGDILNFQSESPIIRGFSRQLIYFSAIFPLVCWPLLIRAARGKKKIKGFPDPHNYKPPKERLRRASGD